jgi:hypothetical protein
MLLLDLTDFECKVLKASLQQQFLICKMMSAICCNLRSLLCIAEVINITAFQEDLGSLNYSVQDDGAVQLAHQPFLEVNPVFVDLSLCFCAPAKACFPVLLINRAAC